jgi:hypothetical protein
MSKTGILAEPALVGRERELELENKILSPAYLKELRRYVKLFQAFFKDMDELVSDQVSLLFWITDTFKSFQESIGSVHVDNVHTQVEAEDGDGRV